MHTRVGRKEKNKNQSVANDFSQKQRIGMPTVQLVDNRPVAVAQRKLQAMANSSLQAKQIAHMQAMMAGNVTGHVKNKDHAVVQRTEIDALKYVDAKGLWYGRTKTNNWLIQLLGELWYADKFDEYNIIYGLLIQNLPEQPLRGTDGYDAPTVYEVNVALGDEIQRLRAVKFQDLTTDMFRLNHVRSTKTLAVDRCRARLRGSGTSNNTVLILSPGEIQAILSTLRQAKFNNWDFIYIQCEEAIQAGLGGIKRIVGVTVKVSFDQFGKIKHLHGEDLNYKKSDNKIE